MRQGRKDSAEATKLRSPNSAFKRVKRVGFGAGQHGFCALRMQRVRDRIAKPARSAGDEGVFLVRLNMFYFAPFPVSSPREAGIHRPATEGHLTHLFAIARAGFLAFVGNDDYLVYKLPFSKILQYLSACSDAAAVSSASMRLVRPCQYFAGTKFDQMVRRPVPSCKARIRASAPCRSPARPEAGGFWRGR